MTGLLEKFGQNFLVATFIPSLGFVLIANFLFSSLLPPDLRGTFDLSLSPTLAGNALLLFILTILFGFTLLGLNTFIYKLFEGYFLLSRIPWILNRQRNKAIRRLSKIRQLDYLITELPKISSNNDKTARVIERLKTQSFSLKAQYKLDYPHDINMVLPTRFGNILRAAETYPGERFGLDAVLMWPRLIHVMDEDYYKKLDQSNNGLAFIVNSMILSLLLAGLCILASGYQYYAWETTSHAALVQGIVCGSSNLDVVAEDASSKLEAVNLLYFLPLGVTCADQQMYWQRIWIYLISSGAFVFASVFFYNASLPAARQYGALIRSAYDLFRFDLIKQLRLTLPKHSGQEIDLWTKWTSLVALGNFALPGLPFLYQYKPDDIGSTLMTEEELLFEFLSEDEIEDLLREEE
jgi:hypothetical protein